MSFRDNMYLCTPRLRRYARALVAAQPAAQDLADDLVRATLSGIREIGLFGRWFDLEVRLFQLLTRIHRDASRTGSLGARLADEKGHFCAGGTARAERAAGPLSPFDKLAAALGELPLEEREALLLVAVEGFSYGRTARILRITRRVLMARLARARSALAQSLRVRPPPPSGKARPGHLRLVE